MQQQRGGRQANKEDQRSKINSSCSSFIVPCCAWVMCAVRSSWVMDKDHDGWHAVSTAMKQMVVVVVVLLLQQGCFGYTTRMLMNDEVQEQSTVLMIWIWIRAQIIGFLKNFVTVSSNVILHVHANHIPHAQQEGTSANKPAKNTWRTHSIQSHHGSWCVSCIIEHPVSQCVSWLDYPISHGLVYGMAWTPGLMLLCDGFWKPPGGLTCVCLNILS